MQFDKREITPHAEPVSGNELKVGSVYFFVTFADDALLIPCLEPVVFVGRNLDASDQGMVYFQDFDSYQQGIRHDSQAKDHKAVFYAGSESETSHAFEYERALEELMRCSLRRKKAEAS